MSTAAEASTGQSVSLFIWTVSAARSAVRAGNEHEVTRAEYVQTRTCLKEETSRQVTARLQFNLDSQRP